MELYIGVDGGGTKTEVALYDYDSQAAVMAAGGASNPNTVGVDNAVAVVMSLILAGLTELRRGAVGGSTSGATLPSASDADPLVAQVRGVSLCMSGVGREAQIAALTSRFQEQFPHAEVEVTNDALAALTAGTQGESGVVLIAGTGSIAVGESWTGTTARAGGYGNLIGDEGGGFDIGRRGLMAAIQFAEQRGATTKLWDAAREVFAVHQPGALIPKVYNATHPVGTVASFARHVLEAAAADEVAMGIVKESAQRFVGMAVSVRKQLEEAMSNRMVLAGGLFTHTTVLADAVRAAFLAAEVDVRCEALVDRPSAGAVLRALRPIHAVVPVDVALWRQSMARATLVQPPERGEEMRT